MAPAAFSDEFFFAKAYPFKKKHLTLSRFNPSRNSLYNEFQKLGQKLGQQGCAERLHAASRTMKDGQLPVNKAGTAPAIITFVIFYPASILCNCRNRAPQVRKRAALRTVQVRYGCTCDPCAKS